MDWTIYWFMFPVSMVVATTAMLSGIGGAALFTPIFLIIFPLLGADYPLISAVAAIGVALLTETFGFSSGFVGYYRKGLIDFRGSIPFIAVGVPVGVAGALLAQFTNAEILKACYGVLMLILSVVMMRHHEDEKAPAAFHMNNPGHGRVKRTVTARDGRVYNFRAPRQGIGAVATAVGAFLTGMVSVGIGEVVMPQLSKRNRIPVPVAAATSVLIVIVVVAAASFTQISSMITAGGWEAVPWNLVCYTIPGVIIGGQIGPRLQGMVAHRTMEQTIGVLFAIIGLAMLWIVFR